MSRPRGPRLTRRAFAEQVGDPELARQLMRTCGGHRVPVSSAAAERRAVRDAAICAYVDRLMHGSVLTLIAACRVAARKWQLSVRRVREVVQRAYTI